MLATTSDGDCAYVLMRSEVLKGVRKVEVVNSASIHVSTGGSVKKLSVFLMLASLAVIPFAVWKAIQTRRLVIDENVRYDINDYLAEEGL